MPWSRGWCGHLRSIAFLLHAQVLFKLDKEGHGEEIERRNLGANEELDFLNWTDNMVGAHHHKADGHLVCTLTGCEQRGVFPVIAS